MKRQPMPLEQRLKKNDEDRQAQRKQEQERLERRING